MGCHRRLRRKKFARNLRIAALLLVLVATAGGSAIRHWRRDLRTQWLRPVSASVVLVSQRSVPEEAVARWRADLGMLEGWFGREWARYRPVSGLPMVSLHLDGVVVVDAFPPTPGVAEGLAERARETLSFSTALEAIDARLAAHDPRDATIYVLLRPSSAGGGSVEGVAEASGRVGLVEGSLDDEDLALELTAVAHELLHCLGATDKYDPQGHALAPEGLADPAANPLFPQLAAEVMVGEIPQAPAQGRPLSRLEEVQVGPATAREIRW